MPKPGDEFPTVGTYRGVAIHDFQPDERIESLVKPAIDRVHSLQDIEQLYSYAVDFQNPPEARLLARAKCEAYFQIAAEERRTRPNIDSEMLRARTAGLNSWTWMSFNYYASSFELNLAPGAKYPPKREAPLDKRISSRRLSHKLTCDELVDVGELHATIAVIAQPTEI